MSEIGKFGLIDLLNLIWLRDASVNGIMNLRMNVEEKVWKKRICETIHEVGREAWKKHICEKILEVGKEVWKDGFQNTEREKEYVMKECHRRERFSDGSVGAKVRLMVKGGCLPIRGSETMKWKYQDDMCGCG